MKTKAKVKVKRRRLPSYALLSALRGPDQSDEPAALDTLKREVTARVRHIVYPMGMLIEVMYVSRPMTTSDLDQVKEAIGQLNLTHHDHYLSHLHDAVHASHRHRVWGGHGDELADAIGYPAR